MRTAADLVVTGGRVRTLDPRGTVAEAIAVKNGRILGVGSAAEAEAVVDRETVVVDGRGRTVMPGFIDSHTHFQKAAVARFLNMNWDAEAGHPVDVDDALAKVADHAKGLPAGEWVRADGINDERLAERRMPTRWELDKVAPDNPVVLIGVGNHSVTANSMALVAAGIDRDTPEPSGGRIERDPTGEPTGVLREMGKLRLDNNHPDSVLPIYGPESRLVPLERMAQDLLACGVTTIHDMIVDPFELAAWVRLNQLGRLPLRVQFFIRGFESKIPLSAMTGLGLEQGLGDAWLRFAGCKLSIDGVCAFRAAAVYEPYPGEPDNLGLDRIPAETLDELVDTAHGHGIRLAVHAVGPRAVDMALDAFEAAFERHGRGTLRHRLEHVHLIPRPGQFERIRELGLLIGVQPNFVHIIGDAWIEAGLTTGHTEGSGTMPLRQMLDEGLTLLSGTDLNGEYFSPMGQVAAAVGRRTRRGIHLDPGQAITVPEAVGLFTTGAAHGGYEEDLKGTIEVGKLADLAVLSRDPFETPVEEMETISVDTTILDGRVVYQR